VIIVRKGSYDLAAAAGLTAITAAEAPFYQQNTRLIEVCSLPVKLPKGDATRTPGVRAVSQAAMHEALLQCADWKKLDAEGKQIPLEPPREIIDMVQMKTGRGSFPSLRGVSATPLMRHDGSLLMEHGYDPATGLFLFNPPALPPIPIQPTRRDALRAFGLLCRELLSEFPFVDKVSRSGAVSLVMTAVQRGGMEVAPMYAISKPSPGTGGSYLVHIVSVIATGERAPVMTWADKEDESEKRLVAAALAQQPIIALDNVNGTLHNDFLGQLVSEPVLLPRKLGKSEQVKIANSSLMIANGNNLVIMLDMVRRTIMIAMDAKMEAPDKRNFKRNPLQAAMRDRGKYIAAVLTILRAYHCAGYPGRLPPRSGFEDWSDTVRSALVWLGQPDPALSTDTLRTEDPETLKRLAFYEAWNTELVTGTYMHTSEIAKKAGEWDSTRGNHHPLLHEAVMAVAGVPGKPHAIDSLALGKWMGRQNHAIIGGLKLTVDYTTNKGRPRFCVSKV
jgi:putative DNA primase/helicase